MKEIQSRLKALIVVLATGLLLLGLAKALARKPLAPLPIPATSSGR
ncbi:MAG: hypothetical protein ACHQ51_06310 [Elusimicrobiota bacterium]